MLHYSKEEMSPKWAFQEHDDPKHTSQRAASQFQTNSIKPHYLYNNHLIFQLKMDTLLYLNSLSSLFYKMHFTIFLHLENVQFSQCMN